MYDIIIVGCGPAGMTAALYALRAGKKVLLFEAKSYGGQILKASIVENYPGVETTTGFDLALLVNFGEKPIKIKRLFNFMKVKSDNSEYSVVNQDL